MNRQKFENKRRSRRKRRIRKKVHGDAERPRLSVFRSLRHIYAQLIDDDSGVTLATASSLQKEFADKNKNAGNVADAAKVGQMLAKQATAVGIRQVRFDRNGYQYHGRVRALGEAARKAGLIF